MPVYCVTGTNRGIGLEIVRQLAQSPSNRIFATVRPEADLGDLKAVSSETTHILACDTGSLTSIHGFAKETARLLSVLGGLKIDYVINGAAVNLASSQNSLGLGPDDFAAMMAINVLGPAKVVEFLLENGALADDVKVGNMTSGLASMVRTVETKGRKCTGYSISKVGLNMLSVHMAEDLRESLKEAVVVVLDPGWVKTRMGGQGAVLEPAESVSGILGVIHGLKAEDNGKFFHHTGSEIPW
ncbi:C-factor [Echria macrotheca]|uniref:C-factor n=1 Tax=Echria macrotheca TaxID=438768 RepID=A0AAJ0B3Y7_9PEZI|nr:C-factor [Echria macrotheca]